MKTLGILLLSMVTMAAVQVSAGSKIIHVRELQDGKLELWIRSSSYCTSPKVELDYSFSGKVKNGPHFYSLKVTPITRIACSGEKIMKSVVSRPENRVDGDRVFVTDSKKNAFSVDLGADPEDGDSHLPSANHNSGAR